jgi:hypothetical protein
MCNNRRTAERLGTWMSYYLTSCPAEVNLLEIEVVSLPVLRGNYATDHLAEKKR